MWTHPAQRAPSCGACGQGLDKCCALAHPWSTLGALAPTSSPPLQRRPITKATASAPSASRIASSSQAIRLRNKPANCRGDSTRHSEKQHRHRPRRPLPLRGQTPRDERPNGEPQRTALRGRRRARRPNRHLALRPPRTAFAPHRGRPPRQTRAGTATRLDAYANPRVKRHRPSWPLRCDTPPDEPSPSPLAMRNLKEKKSCPCVTSP